MSVRLHRIRGRLAFVWLDLARAADEAETKVARQARQSA